jgi:signal transduction histidine kinase
MTRRSITFVAGAARLVLASLVGAGCGGGTPKPATRTARAELSRVVEGLTSVLDGLREIALGIHPAIPVELDVHAEARLPESVQVAAYYVVSEALTNAAKYARASVVHVEVEARDRVLRVSVRDDGLGGADPARGSGLLGLKDRAEAMGGTISLQSPRGAGTSLRVELPLDENHQ